MFDEIFWTFIDQRYYGALTTLADRMQLLSKEQQCDIDKLASLKSHQSNEEEGFDDRYPIDKLLEL